MVFNCWATYADLTTIWHQLDFQVSFGIIRCVLWILLVTFILRWFWFAPLFPQTGTYFAGISIKLYSLGSKGGRIPQDRLQCPTSIPKCFGYYTVWATLPCASFAYHVYIRVTHVVNGFWMDFFLLLDRASKSWQDPSWKRFRLLKSYAKRSLLNLC